jgi:hypothetical protein
VRQFLTWQFWLSLVALAAITLVLVLVVGRNDRAPEVAAPVGEQSLVANAAGAEQPIDLIVLVFAAQADRGFDIVDGRTTARIIIYIDGFRYMNIPAGTPGENRCGELDQLARCVVAADVLGDAVLWFSILPNEPRNLITLPGVVDVRDGGNVLLANGWVIRRAPIIERDTEDCKADTVSLSDFIERFAERSTSTYSMDDQRITTVTCLAET